MAFETLLVEREGAVVTVTLNRPKQLNAINRTMVRELDELAAGLEGGPPGRAGGGGPARGGRAGGVSASPGGGGGELPRAGAPAPAAGGARFGQPEVNLGV